MANPSPPLTSRPLTPAARLIARDLGRVDYRAAQELMAERVDARAAGRVPDTLLLLEHPPVITLGRRRSAQANVLMAGDTPVVAVERGGDATWHGPGQLVGYPILALGPDERDLHAVLRRLEEALIAVLAAVGLPGERRPGHTGVWCRGKKVASLGVAVRHWVTFHGLALNVDPDLTQFARIHPCGMDAGVMGSIASLGGDRLADGELEGLVAREIARAFGRRFAGIEMGSEHPDAPV